MEEDEQTRSLLANHYQGFEMNEPAKENNKAETFPAWEGEKQLTSCLAIPSCLSHCIDHGPESQLASCVFNTFSNLISCKLSRAVCVASGGPCRSFVSWEPSYERRAAA